MGNKESPYFGPVIFGPVTGDLWPALISDRQNLGHKETPYFRSSSARPVIISPTTGGPATRPKCR